MRENSGDDHDEVIKEYRSSRRSLSGNLIHRIQQSQLNDLHAGQTPPANLKNQQTPSNEIPIFHVF